MFCYQKNFSNPTLPVDEAQFWALVKATQWNENIDKYRETHDAALKRKLPAFIFQATFDETTSKAGKLGQWRKQAATRLTGLVVMDIDHVEDPKALFDSWGLSNSKEPRIATPHSHPVCENQGKRIPEFLNSLDQKSSLERILLVYITPSGKGLKVVFKADPNVGNLIDNQHAMAEVLGVEVDESCKDASRMSFICKESDIMYIDKELFTYENKEFAERYDALYRDGHSAAENNYSKEPRNQGNIIPKFPDSLEKKESVEIKWRGYDVQSIIDARYADKLPCAADSNRHNESLKLASDLLIMFDGDKQKTLAMLKAQPWVQEIIDERDENVEQTVSSAAQRMAEREKKYLSQQPSKAMQDAIKEATGQTYQEVTQAKASTSVAVTEGDIERWLWDWGEQIESLFDDFPLLRDICKGLKKNQYPAAMFVAGGLMMTLMTRCTYRFYHRPEELRRLNNSTLIIGDPASGKSFATRLFKLLAAPIVAADKVGKDAINA